MSNRELNQRRISWATRGLAVAAAVATGIFAAAAEHATKAARAGNNSPATVVQGDAQAGEGGFWGGDDVSSAPLTPSQSAPQQTFSAPVASSGGS